MEETGSSVAWVVLKAFAPRCHLRYEHRRPAARFGSACQTASPRNAPLREVSTTSPAARRRWIAFDIFDHHGAVNYSIAWVTSLPVDKEADCVCSSSLATSVTVRTPQYLMERQAARIQLARRPTRGLRGLHHQEPVP